MTLLSRPGGRTSMLMVIPSSPPPPPPPPLTLSHFFPSSGPADVKAAFGEFSTAKGPILSFSPLSLGIYTFSPLDITGGVRNGYSIQVGPCYTPMLLRGPSASRPRAYVSFVQTLNASTIVHHYETCVPRFFHVAGSCQANHVPVFHLTSTKQLGPAGLDNWVRLVKPSPRGRASLCCDLHQWYMHYQSSRRRWASIGGIPSDLL